ncbi:UNVERIFIED_CONTAM: hypothetical protein PYX00_011349 [Menopon gallinae]|uniref:RNase III domain-containing protein n=1 Tax=Menopon gallinae TaxID=328185 RepID=A0AAW2H7C5_9NEOP
MAAHISTKSLTCPDRCGIYRDEDEATTLSIESMLSSHTRVLLVCDDAYAHSYSSVRNVSHLSLYEIIRTGAIAEKLQITASKFFFLALSGHIGARCFDHVLVRLPSAGKELAYSLRQLSAGGWGAACISVFLKKIDNKDPLFLGLRNLGVGGGKRVAGTGGGGPNGTSSGDGVPASCGTHPHGAGQCLDSVIGGLCIAGTSPEAALAQGDGSAEREDAVRLRLIVVDPTYTPLIEGYIYAKILLASCIKQASNRDMERLLRRAVQVERVSFGLAFELIRSNIELKGVGPQSFQVAVEFGDIRQLLLSEAKFQRTTQILEEADSRVFVIAENKDIFDLVRDDLRAKIHDPCGLTPEELAEVSGESVLLFYDQIHTDIAAIPFRKVVVLHPPGGGIDDILHIREAQRRATAGGAGVGDEAEFARLAAAQGPCFLVKETNASVPRSMAYKMLANFFYLLKKYLDEHMLFVKDMSIQCQYECVEAGFVCTLVLPYLYDHGLFTGPHASGLHARKRDARNEISARLFELMHREGFMDNNFFPTERFVRGNKVYNAYLREVYGTALQDDISRQRREFLCKRTDSSQAEDLFRRKHSLFLTTSAKRARPGTPAAGPLPTCLLSYPGRFHVYAFSEDGDGSLGMCCGASFEEEVRVGGVHMKYLHAVEFTLNELDAIVFFQVLFFGLHFRKVRELSAGRRACCYLAVPIRDGGVDMQFLNTFLRDFMKSSVYEQTDSSFRGCLVFNPITRMFFTFHSELGSSIEERVIPMQGRSFFAKDNITGYGSYAEYFEEKYKTKLLHKHGGAGLLFRGSFYTGKGESQAYSVMSSEVMHVTPIKKDFFRQYAMFVRCFAAFETAALAFDLKAKLGLSISVEGIATALTPKKGGKGGADACYERYEFLGDSVLKYVSTKHMFLSGHKCLGDAVKAKDLVVCNANLQRIAEGLGIPAHLRPAERVFQPPSLFELVDAVDDPTYRENMREYARYFRVDRAFLTAGADERPRGAQEAVGPHAARGEKVYADVLEAIIGMYMLERGLEGASDFIYSIGLLAGESGSLPVGMGGCNKVLEIHEISLVEHKLGYVFESKGLLEQAIIHPSAHTSIFGPSDFQSLELLGDCSIDLLVTQDIFRQHPGFGPGELSVLRKGLVNNFSLARVLFHLGLVPHIHTCFSAEHMLRVQDRIAKDGNTLSAATYACPCKVRGQHEVGLRDMRQEAVQHKTALPPGPMILQLFVINKSGGLIYAFERARRSDVNDLMVLTSTMHSIGTIFSGICSDASMLDSTQVFVFRMHTITLYRAATGTSFMFVGREPACRWVKAVYRMYVDYVMRDPFYVLEMPIKSRGFRPETLLEEIL